MKILSRSKSSKFRGLWLIPFTATILAMSIWFINNTNDNIGPWTQHSVIAHAGGAVNGDSYTNSREAVVKNYSAGYRVFEIDFTMSKDGKPVAKHDWIDSDNQTSTPLTYSDFMTTKYLGKYTTLDIKSVVQLMKKYRDMYVVIDAKIESADDTTAVYGAISNNLHGVEPSVSERIIAQIFYESDLKTVRSYGFKNILYVPGREGYDFDRIIEFSKLNSINAVSLYYKRVSKKSLGLLKENEIKPYIYTLNEPAQIKSLHEIGAYGFFTDFLTPKEIDTITKS